MQVPVEQTIILSLKIALAAVAFNTPFCLFVGWYLARRQFRGKTLIETLVNMPLVVPPVVTGYFLLIVFGRKGLLGQWLYAATGLALSFSWQAAALAAAVVSFPLFANAVRVAIENVDPRLEEAARVLRAGRWRVYLQVTLPLSMNGIAAGLFLCFARSLGEFGATIMVAGNIPGRTQTIPLAIYSLVNQADEQQALILVGISILISYASLFAGQVLQRRWQGRKTHE
ncbi:MAG: molybdate ABC transporter permease subunit [Deferribacteres bacterium]|nr:molybdate ABC transporter permease subunit [candidate division KSB1 bacterium]MCB9510591.1 molybdate ABC transporter permease subunit [Deferribacteres bacterium]